MNVVAGSPPALTVTTAEIEHSDLIARLDPRSPLAFVRRGEGIVGLGESVRLEFRGPTRIRDAAAAWRELVANAQVTDPLHLPGSGLIAFGSFAFAEDSAATSVLIVPSIVLGRRGNQSWMTVVDSAVAPRTAALGAEFRSSLHPGRLDAAGYTAAVAAALTRIEAGHLRKVVLARDLAGRIPAEADLRLPIAHLARVYADTYTFAVDGLIGSSPETLVRSKGGVASARVLAGSVARGRDADADSAAATGLKNSSKDRDEHAFAVRSVVTALAPHTRDLAASDEPFTLKLPNLWHLATDVSAPLTDGSSALDLVAALHPTAAVAGSPTQEAVDLLAELEGFDRERYAGPIGWVGASGDGEWAVALRCAQVDADGSVRAYAGAGIVAGSEPERELAETILKFRPIVDAFGAQSRLL